MGNESLNLGLWDCAQEFGFYFECGTEIMRGYIIFCFRTISVFPSRLNFLRIASCLQHLPCPRPTPLPSLTLYVVGVSKSSVFSKIDSKEGWLR